MKWPSKILETPLFIVRTFIVRILNTVGSQSLRDHTVLYFKYSFVRGSRDLILSLKGIRDGPVGNQFVNSRAPRWLLLLLLPMLMLLLLCRLGGLAAGEKGLGFRVRGLLHVSIREATLLPSSLTLCGCQKKGLKGL